jgi:hypothetical protein
MAVLELAALPALQEATGCTSTGVLSGFICRIGWADHPIEMILNSPLLLIFSLPFTWLGIAPWSNLKLQFYAFDVILVLALAYPLLLLLARKFRTLGLVCVLPAIMIVAALYGAFKFQEHNARVALMPADLEVTGILYSKEENWGSILLPLPGDNETGIFMYGLTDAIANRIAHEGLDFFYRSENVKRRVGGQRSHSEWQETPMGKTIDDYLDQYGFGIAVDPSVKSLVDDAISKPGSFYSYGRTGIVIVIPDFKRAIFAYAG